MANEKANQTASVHFREITGIIDRINAIIKQITRDIDRLRVMKEEILDNAELKAELKKIVDVWPGITMESIIADYQRFQSLRDWLEENDF